MKNILHILLAAMITLGSITVVSAPVAASHFDNEFDGFGGFQANDDETDAAELQTDDRESEVAVGNGNNEIDAAGFWTVAEGSGVEVDNDDIRFDGFQTTGERFEIEADGIEIDDGNIESDDLFQTDSGRFDVSLAGGGSIETDTFEIDSDGSVETDTFEIDRNGFETEDVEVDSDGSIDVRNGANLETNDVDIKDGDIEIDGHSSIDIEIDSNGDIEID